MEKDEKTQSKNTRKETIAIWWACIGVLLLFSFVPLVLVPNFQNLTEDDFTEIEITFDRFKLRSSSAESGGGGIPTIYPKLKDNNEQCFVILTEKFFNQSEFQEYVSLGDTIMLMVITYQYEKRLSEVVTFGVRKGNMVFMDFSEALNYRVKNDKLLFTACVTGFPSLAGGLAIGFFIWFFTRNIGINKASSK